MAAKDLILDFDAYDLGQIVAGREVIERYNPQRFEFEQLTAIIHEDPQARICAGYLDIPNDVFWARGHMPGWPLMPGVLMCEAAAQLCSYFSGRHDLLGVPTLGFGGIDQVRFREIVRPGDRLVIVLEVTRLRRGSLIVARFQEFVGRTLVCDGEIRGIPLPFEPPVGPTAAPPAT